MKVGIHQPNFLPWIGYFYKISQSDCFVFLDNVQFSKGSYTNRVLINTLSGPRWLTVPVSTAKKELQLINEISYIDKWQIKICNILANNYSKSPYYKKYIDRLSEIFFRLHSNISDTNIDLITYICNELEIKTKLIKSSDFSFTESSSTERLIKICKELKATVYLSGSGGSKYQDEESFYKNNITLEYLNYNYTAYKQYGHDNFNKGLSIIDLLFNCGTESFGLQ